MKWVLLIILLHVFHIQVIAQELLLEDNLVDNRNVWKFSTNSIDQAEEFYREQICASEKLQNYDCNDLLSRAGFILPYEGEQYSLVGLNGLRIKSDVGNKNFHTNKLAEDELFQMYDEKFEKGVEFKHGSSAWASLDISDLELSDDLNYKIELEFIIDELYNKYSSKKVKGKYYYYEVNPRLEFDVGFWDDNGRGQVRNFAFSTKSIKKVIKKLNKIEFISSDGKFLILLNSELVGEGESLDAPRSLYEKHELIITVSQALVRLNKISITRLTEYNFNSVEAASDASELPNVDIGIPVSRRRNPEALAVIIGNSNYTNGITHVDFAANDSRMMKQYLIDVLGYNADNITYLENATERDMESVFGKKNVPGDLYYDSKGNQKDIFIYYSGHGAPDINNKNAYILPVDAEPNRIALTGYSVETLYGNLSQLDARSVTVIIDACFSGYSGSGNVLLKNMSPVGIKVNNPAINLSNGLIITASKNDQVASWLPQKKHGLLTYFYLLGLRGGADINKNSQIEPSEWKRFLQSDETVPYWARKLYSRDQMPQVYFSK